MMNVRSRLVSQAIVVLGLMSAVGTVSAQSWSNQANMKVARVEATTVDYRDDIYVFNGFKPGIQIADSVEKYDSATKQWSIIGSTSTASGNAVTHNGVVRSGADVWIIGGRIGSHPGRVTNNVWIYNLTDGNWRRGPDLPTPGAAGGAALVNNKIHWFGGIDSNANCDVGNHFVYDLGQPNAGWNNITGNVSMPSPRNHFSTAVVDGIIYAMGGQYGHDNCPGKTTDDTSLVHAFNPQNNSWSRKADMPNKNSHSEPGTFVYKGEIYTTGGENALDKVWKYNPNSNSWSTFRTLPERLVAPIARIIDGRLIVAGGGAPIAAQSISTVRSMLVDNNPPNPQPDPQPQPDPEPPVPAPGSHTPEGATVISMEAEYFDIRSNTSTHQWVNAAIGNSSNDDAMITTPDQGDLAGSTENTPMLSYMVNFNFSGKHYIWVRGLGDTGASGIGNSDSIQVGLNGTLSDTAYRIDTFPSTWTWSRHTPMNPVASLNVVNAGVNMVNFWMREDGLAFDKFVITSDPNFVPTGNGPEITDGSSGYVLPGTDNDVDDNATDDEPVDSTPIDDSPIDDSPVDESPIDESPVDDSPVDDSPVDDSPVDESPIDDSLVDEAPNDNSPTDIDPLNDDPVDNDSANENDTSTTDTYVSSWSSRKGVFGGSASLSSLLALLAIFSIRVARPRYVRAA